MAQNFSATRKGFALAASAAAAPQVLSAGGTPDLNFIRACTDVLVDNKDSAYDVWLLFSDGNAGDVADSTCVRVPAGWMATLYKGSCTHVSIYHPTQTPAPVFNIGQGS